MIFETHAHYDDEQFHDDRAGLIGSFPQNGIEYVVNIGSSVESCIKTVELVKQYDFFYAALGVHPSEVQYITDEFFEWLEEEIKTNLKVKAVGEIGLDYYWQEPERRLQKMWFERQIELAKRRHKPIVIHSRDAAKDTYEMMSALKCGETGGVIHCFSYSIERYFQFSFSHYLPPDLTHHILIFQTKTVALLSKATAKMKLPAASCGELNPLFD